MTDTEDEETSEEQIAAGGDLIDLALIRFLGGIRLDSLSDCSSLSSCSFGVGCRVGMSAEDGDMVE